MRHLSRLEDIEELYATRGGLRYGEGVTQLEHALQCAALAQEAKASPKLVVAALLHDIGHLPESEELTQSGFDDRHERVGAELLGALFDDEVCVPIGLHVAAKRYLCFKDAAYFQGLSGASRQSLVAQGGPFDQAQASAFERERHWQNAVALRRFDDTGKREEPTRLTFANFVPPMRAALR